MGGNALPLAKTRRYEAVEYFELWKEIYLKIKVDHRVRGDFDLIPAYHEKESFGDMDILYTGDISKQFIQNVFEPTQIVVNGDVTSFDYKELQIDLIKTTPQLFLYALGYYSYNDLGNLVGKLTRRLGCKHGHNGLYLPVRDGDRLIGEILLTTDIFQTYWLVELDTETYNPGWGFANHEEIFNFVASSPFYDPELYKLENLNHTAKVRDKKRETYRKFLEFGERWTGPKNEVNPDKAFYLNRVLSFFGKHQEFDQLMQAYAMKKLASETFNGEKVQDWTGLVGKDLGHLMAFMKKDQELEPAKVVYFGESRVKKHVMKRFEEWKATR